MMYQLQFLLPVLAFISGPLFYPPAEIYLMPIIYPTTVQAAPVEPLEATPKSDLLLLRDFIERLPKYEQERFWRIIWCESRYRQFKEDGTILQSPTNDVGILQINIAAHGKAAKKADIDVYTTKGNLEMGRHIYDVQGLNAWVCNRLIDLPEYRQSFENGGRQQMIATDNSN